MEVVLLWLDDLDDCLFVALGAAEQLRRFCLRVGLGAAVALASAELLLLAPALTSVAAGVAAASVGLWLTVAVCGALAYPAAAPEPAHA